MEEREEAQVVAAWESAANGKEITHPAAKGCILFLIGITVCSVLSMVVTGLHP